MGKAMLETFVGILTSRSFGSESWSMKFMLVLFISMGFFNNVGQGDYNFAFNFHDRCEKLKSVPKCG